MNLLCEHEREYIRGRNQKTFDKKSRTSGIKVGGFGRTRVKELFVYGNFEAAEEHKEDLNLIIEPSIRSVGDSDRWQLVWL